MSMTKHYFLFLHEVVGAIASYLSLLIPLDLCLADFFCTMSLRGRTFSHCVIVVYIISVLNILGSMVKDN